MIAFAPMLVLHMRCACSLTLPLCASCVSFTVFDMLYGGVFQRFMLSDHGRAWAERFAQPLEEARL